MSADGGRAIMSAIGRTLGVTRRELPRRTALFIIESDGPSSQSSAAFHHDVPVRAGGGVPDGTSEGWREKVGWVVESRRLKERPGAVPWSPVDTLNTPVTVEAVSVRSAASIDRRVADVNSSSVRGVHSLSRSPLGPRRLLSDCIQSMCPPPPTPDLCTVHADIVIWPPGSGAAASPPHRCVVFRRVVPWRARRP